MSPPALVAAAAVAVPSHFQRAHFFAEAADVVAVKAADMFPVSSSSAAPVTAPLPDSVWASRIMLSLQTVAFPLALWFKPVCVCFALFWLTWRAYEVLNKPLDELASLLGFDIPLTPVIDLAGIKADGAIVHWQLPEKQKHKSTLKYEIHLNGNVIDTVKFEDSAVTITGLQPESFYVVRVALVNSLEFSSKSLPIRFRTKSATSTDCFQNAVDEHNDEHDAPPEALVKPYRGLKDVILPASPDTTTPPLNRDSSSGLVPKRASLGRRHSPGNFGIDSRNDESEVAGFQDGYGTVQHLTEKLDTIRRETDEAERQAKEEEEEEMKQKDELVRERDELRGEVAEKDKANRNLKREVNALERQNTAAQNERSKHERLLQQKNQDRQKLKEDVVRWREETEQMKGEVGNIKERKTDHQKEAAQEKEALRQKLDDEAATLKTLDEEIREKTAEIKKLERAAKNSSPNGTEPETSLVQLLQQQAEEDRAYGVRRFDLQQQYRDAYTKLEHTRAFYQAQTQFLEKIRAERRRAEEAALAASAREFASPVSPNQERGIMRGDSQRSRRGTSDSPRMGAFAPVSQGPFGASISASAFSSAPFLNIHNGMTITGPVSEGVMSDEDREKLTGGAPMSPGTGEGLLPADLFSGEENIQPLPGLGALSGLPGPIPGLGPQPSMQDHPGPGPASPASASSRSPSNFASPRASQNNLNIGSPENVMDADRRSIRSTRSNRATSGSNTGSRFSSIFGIRPRKTASTDDDATAGPPLGKIQSQSMPRQDQGLSGLDSATRKRNSSISGTVFGGVLGKPEEDIEKEGLVEAPADTAGPSRRRPFNFWNREKTSDGWPSTFTAGLGRRPASPRPGSTHSNELPRPSFDSSRWGMDAWPSNDATNGARSSPLSFNGWGPSVAQQPRNFGSRHPSRRPSVQHGVSGPPDDIIEDDDSDVLDSEQEPHLAPIGTRPAIRHETQEQDQDQDQADSSTTPQRLNPNAKDFKSFFSSMTRRDRDKSKETGEALTPLASSSNTPVLGREYDEDSPPNSRKSRDTRSMTTIESSLAESSRNSNDLARTPSYSNSDVQAGPSPLIGTGSFGKESFMQKITRKSSSGKFSLPTFKRDKSRLDPQVTPTATPTEDDEDGMSASMGSLKEGRESREAQRGSGRSWSNVLKLGKKKGGETPSVSGLSMTSDANEDDESVRSLVQ